MIQDLSKEQMLRFSSILFKDDHSSKRQVQNLNQQEKEKLKSIYSQKIAYQTVNAHIQPPPETVQGQTAQRNQSGVIGTVCCCFYPQSSFDITTEYFLGRVKRTLVFFKNDFLQYQKQNKQLYGTVWITITYIIALGIAANLNQYFIGGKNYQFKSSLMLKGFGIGAIFQIAQIFIYAAVVKCLKGQIQNMESAMINGYSFLLYIIPTILCLIPSLWWHVGILSVAAIIRGIFLMRNYGSRVQQKLLVLAGVILLIEVVYMVIILKVMFANHSGKTFAQGSKKVFGHMESRQYDF